MVISGKGEVATAVEAEQVRTLFRQPPAILFVNPINAAIVAAVLWRPTGHGLILAWVAAALLVALGRLWLRARYVRAPFTIEDAPRWARGHMVGAAAAGMLWGLAGALFYDPNVMAVQLILVFVIGGMIAGAAGTMANHLPSFFGYAVSAIVPLTVRIMLEGDRLHVAMGALALVYGVALTIVATNTHRALAETFRLRFENEDLLGRLSSAQRSLEESNRTLEQRVVERGAALERQAEALREARRLESLGLLAGGVAHDFNNLLTVVLGNTLVMLSEEGERDPAEDRASLEEIRGAAQRAASLVSQLLAFSRRQIRKPRVLDLNGVVMEMQRLLARLIGEHVELVVSRWAGPLAVEADPTQLEQVIINLATNARDAMRAGGKLTIETEEVTVAAGGLPDAPGVGPGTWVALSVRDTGVGMDAETRRLVFHPFFTTKEVGQGTGLGLATVHGIVEQSAGHVFVESEPGKGSCFRVFLPRAAGPIAVAGLNGSGPVSAGEAVAPPRPRSTTVLVAEDERMVRAVTARALRRAGFLVIEADDGEQALERARAHDGPIDLLVTDVVMARMGGPELAKELSAQRPGVRVLFVSGYSRNAVLPSSDAVAGVDFLGKPFTPDVLVDRVARLLAAPPPPAPSESAKPEGGPTLSDGKRG